MAGLRGFFTASVLLIAALSQQAAGVKHSDFKTCAQSGFCNRNRQFADNAASTFEWKSPYEIDPETIKLDNGKLSATILKKIGDNDQTVRLPMELHFLQSGSARLIIDEERRQKGDITLRHDSTARKERYNEVEDWVIVGNLETDSSARVQSSSEPGITDIFFGKGRHQASIKHQPFSIEFLRQGEVQVKLNDGGLLNLEHWRSETESDEELLGQWDESFGGHTDSKPRGPESVALDISFPGYEHIFGVPEHASSISLKQTRGGDGNYDEPYRLYNADVFEYELDSPMTLYGSIPFMQAHRKGSTVGVFWMNSAETWIDIVKTFPRTNPLSLGTKPKGSTSTHWISESGLIDLFVFLGPTSGDVLQEYGRLTGYTSMPQDFALGYHQCRWNYNSVQDTIEVSRRLEANLIPFDTIWLDIEYTDNKKYFTWDPSAFKDPIRISEELGKSGHKLVTIIDPHIKNDKGYYVDKQLVEGNYGVLDKRSELYEGSCWPGSSHWIDSLNPKTAEWWKGLYKYDSFPGTNEDTFFWNDMNEPSVFGGPEITMPKDNLHDGNWEHRDVHNIYGLGVVTATYNGILARDLEHQKRPFTLTRSFYSGSQRLGATWTGDNAAKWEHLAASIPMVLNNGIAGYPFIGADVGGFFGNPKPELLTRWYQAGIFYPLLRAHAHIDTERREPYLLEEPYKSAVIKALRIRYQMLPVWYTAFHETSTTGAPVVRPNFFVHPDDEAGFTIDDQLYLGSSGILAKPVTSAGATSASVYISDSQPYFDFFDFTRYAGSAGRRHVVPAPLGSVPILVRAGSIVPTRVRPRRSAKLMRADPYTLTVVLPGPSAAGASSASGSLYHDDGESFAYRDSGAFAYRSFTFSAAEPGRATLQSESHPSAPAPAPAASKEYAEKVAAVRVERVVVVNVPESWSRLRRVRIEQAQLDGSGMVAINGDAEDGSGEVAFHPAEGDKAAWVEVKNPRVSVSKDWRMHFVVD